MQGVGFARVFCGEVGISGMRRAVLLGGGGGLGAAVAARGGEEDIGWQPNHHSPNSTAVEGNLSELCIDITINPALGGELLSCV